MVQFNDLAAGETATDSFTYTVDDGNGGTDTATVTVTINGANDGPVAAADDTGSVGERWHAWWWPPTAVTCSNDDVDPDGDSLSVLSRSARSTAMPPMVGVAVRTRPPAPLLTMNADGSYSYDPNGAIQ